ncbi:low affinity immunoglobulin gamma Fc region receptor III-A-like [Clinocottus analis]|uniref:low affinity immunoglobulin gamma Fc region receptor III-A-like n=1 Tax=Clinocottus analis TaxID=304258 RepID=UPI0035C05D98
MKEIILFSFLSAVGATLVIQPNTSQFFWYESITLTCGEAGSPDGWLLKRNTSAHTSQMCNSDWGVSSSATRSSCVIKDAYPPDSGVYWCQSELGENSHSVNVTVTAGDVILKSPALPVTEGDAVTLLCAAKEVKSGKAAPDSSAKFYKDGVFLGNQSAGSVAFSKVSKSDEGFYSCELPVEGKSPQSWLAVQARAEPPPLVPMPRLVCAVLLFVLHVVMFTVCVSVHRHLAKARADSKKGASPER